MSAGRAERPNLQQAYLVVYEPSTTGSLAEPGPEIDRIRFQFNPKQLELNKKASWERGRATANESSSAPQFIGTDASELRLEMFFDASAMQDDSVVKNVEKLFTLTTPLTKTIEAKKPSPPWVVFRWGSLTGFLAIVTDVDVKYSLFTPAGTPIRASARVTVEELSGQPAKTNPTSGTPVPHRVHEVVEGECLPAIAYREYGIPALWRAVAEVNRIDDPMRVRPGERLLLPPLDELASTGPLQRRFHDSRGASRGVRR